MTATLAYLCSGDCLVAVLHLRYEHILHPAICDHGHGPGVQSFVVGSCGSVLLVANSLVKYRSWFLEMFFFYLYLLILILLLQNQNQNHF